MNGLMLHCGANALTRSDLATLPTPDAQGPHHVVRPFIEDVELVSDTMRETGIHIESEAFGVTYDEDGTPQRFFGLIQTRVDNFDGSQGYGLMVGLRGSYDQTLARALAVGSRVFICDNLAFSGEVTIKTKQTLNVARRIPALLSDAVKQIPVMAERQHNRFDAYKNVTLDDKGADHALVDMVRHGILAPTHFGRALQEWDEPSHAEHAEQGRSLWRLHNAVTQAIKPVNAARAAVPATWARTRPMTEYFDQLAGLEPIEAEAA